MTSIEELKDFLPEYLENKGMNLHKGGFCLVCGNGNNTPCFHYDQKKQRVKCFSCGFSGDLIDLIGAEYNLTNSEAIQRAREMFSGHKPINNKPIKENATEDPREIERYIKTSKAAVSKTDYFYRRGLTAETIATFNLGYDERYNNAVIPYPNENYYFKRGIASDFKGKPKGLPQPIFNLQDLYNADNQPVFITEGQFDALSFIECGAYSIGLGGTGGVSMFIEQIKKKPTLCPIIIATDADEAGEKAAEQLKIELLELGIVSERLKMLDGCKDPNECLVSDRSKFESLIDRAIEGIFSLQETRKTELSEAYKKETCYVRNTIYDVVGSFGTERFEPFATGIKPLDEALQGGLLYGLCVIGAESSRGKSTLAMQIAENMSEAGNDVLYFALEMSTADLVARGISRQDFLSNKDKAHSAMEILKGQMSPTSESIKKYAEVAGNIVIIENTKGTNAQDICERARKHKAMTGRAPIVVVDYIQILQPIDKNDGTEKLKLDRAVTMFQNLGIELGTPVIGISSFNRGSYGSISMAAFKESGGVEYTAEYCIGLGLTKQGLNEDETRAELQKQPRDMSTYILKARRSGSVGSKVDFKYYSKYSHFEPDDKGLAEWQNRRKPACK